jgi:hypothetical protein
MKVRDVANFCAGVATALLVGSIIWTLNNTNRADAELIYPEPAASAYVVQP